VKKVIYILFLFSTLLFGEKIYNVDELIVKTFKASPDLNISRLNFQVSQKKYDQAFSGYLPKIDLNANLSHLHRDGLINTSKDIEDDMLVGSLTLQQLIYDFGGRSSNVASFKEQMKYYDASVAEKLLTKKRDVKLAYYNILKNMSLIGVSKEALKLNKAQLYRSKRYYESGIRTKIDISDAKVRVVKAEIDLKNAEFDLEKAYTRLDRVVGIVDEEYKVYNKEVDLTQNLYEKLPPYDLDIKEAVKFAYNNRPEIKKYMFDIVAQKELQKSVGARYYPQIYFDAGYEKQDAEKYSEFLDADKWDVMLNLNWNLYTGGSDKAKKEQQVIETQKSISKLNSLKLFIKEDVTNAYIALKKARETLKLSQSLLNVSKEKFEQVSKQYKYGLSDYIELQIARQEYIDAKNALVIKYYEYFSALAILDATVGR